MSAGRPEPTFVSTGRLPPPEAVGALVVEAHERFGEVDEGANSDVYAALGLVPSDLFGKSGIGGGVVTVAPGKGALGKVAPRLDPAGNSVKGQLAARFLPRRLGLDIFSSEAKR